MNASYQREAVARLTTYCETLISRGVLSEDKEIYLRALVNTTCEAFDMATVAERAPGQTNQEREPSSC